MKKNRPIWHLEKRNISELTAYEKNARILGEKKHRLLSDSLEEFGVIDKPSINLDNIIIGGHQRVTVLMEKGAQEIECWVPDRLLSEKEVEKLNVVLNHGGDWDYDILGNLFEVGDLLNWGFDEDDLGLGKAEKAAKPIKAVISFEFADKETMLANLPKCEEIAQESAAKLKVRG